MDYIGYIWPPWRIFQIPQIFQDWREKRRRRCVVLTKYPPMKIFGRAYEYEDIINDRVGSYYAFVGVPYAEAPIFGERFQPPRPLQYGGSSPRIVKAERWTLNCSPEDRIGMFESAEDCLYVNIYMLNKPKVNLRNPVPLPVMVFIHGGGQPARAHDTSQISPVRMIEQNLIFVTVHYRHGIFGFMSLGTENCRGNAGLKDQALALRWVKENIVKFGGDPDNITLCGHTSGATCVNLHMISPLSNRLFRKAIVMAGGMYCPWGFTAGERKLTNIFQKETRREDLQRFAASTLRYNDSSFVLNIGRKITNHRLSLDPDRMKSVFGPCIEKFEDGAFMTRKTIENCTEEAPYIPVLAGMVKHEGYMEVQELSIAYKDEGGLSNLLIDTGDFGTFLMKKFLWGRNVAEFLMNKLMDEYIPLESIDVELCLSRLISDIWFHRFFDNFYIGSNGQPLYVYEFDYLAKEDLRNAPYEDEKIEDRILLPLKSPVHGDDRMYLFNPQRLKKLCDEQLSDKTKFIVTGMSALWGNFCREKNLPKNFVYKNTLWKPHTNGKPYYLRIYERGIEGVPKLLNAERWSFMKELLQSHFTLPRLELTHISLIDEYLNSLKPSVP